jgi:regulator of protease activity HflC (stomatin/prohibitin superfamily)
MNTVAVFVGIVAFIFLMVVLNSIRIIREWERGVLLRLGRYHSVKAPGIRVVWPVIDKLWVMDLRIVTMDVAKQEMMTRDNVPVTVDAVIYFQIVNAEDAIIKVENFVKATSLIAQTSLRSVVGQSELDELLAERDKLNQHLQTIIDEQTEPWGIKVTAVEIRDVILPEGMKRSMANQAETERMRRAKVINAQGEFQASQKLADAAKILSANPQALQLRFLQTLTEVASERNSTIVFPVPLDLFTPFIKRMAAQEAEAMEKAEGSETEG